MSSYSPPSKGYKELNNDTQSDDAGGKDFIRYMGRVERSKLTGGKLIQVVDSTSKLILEFPLALFNAALTKKELVVDDKIVITNDLSTQQATRLFQLLLQVPKAGCFGDFPTVENTRTDLEFHSVAEALGLGSFTQRIFDLYVKRVNSRIPAVANIEAIAAIRTPPADKIFKQMAWNIAVKYYEGEIENREAFEKYLTTNPRLYAAIDETVAREHIAAQHVVQHENNHVAFLERERRREERAHRIAEHEAWDKESQADLRAQLASEKVKQQERQEKEKAIRKSMLEKKRAGQKLNAEEARAHEKLFGKAVAQ